MTTRRRLLVSVLALALAGSTLRAQPPTVPEYSAKAGFLTTIARYTTWPPEAFASPEAPIVIGVLGTDPFGDILVMTAAASRGGRPIQVRNLRAPRDADGVHIVFIGKAESRNEASWIAALKDKPILTVGESGETLARGGILEFIRVQDKIGFAVSLPAVQQAGLRLSSDLLSHAKRVVQ
jgi:hypothetical protein